MRSYGQYCAVAKALDVVGDRWKLLIVRELVLSGSCRYTDLLKGLPGIATNLLADRLTELEEVGVIRRVPAQPPIAVTLFQLTPRGQDLAPVVRELGRWGGPLLAHASPDDAFRSHWLAVPVELHLTDRKPNRPPITIQVRTGDQPIVIQTAGGRVKVRQVPAQNPDAVLSGPPQEVVGLLMGRLNLDQARARGVGYSGDPKTLRRVQPVKP